MDLAELSSHSCFQIGVGAVFISTLAQSRLEVPHDPPSSQQDILAIALQPIVSFVVLGSILTRMSPRFRFRGRFFIFAPVRWPFHSLLFSGPPHFNPLSLDSGRPTRMAPMGAPRTTARRCGAYGRCERK